MLEDLLDEIRSQDRRLVVYGEDDSGLADRFASHDVSVVHRDLPPEVPEPFVVVEEDGTFAGAIALSSLTTLLEPPITRPGEREDISVGYRVLFDALDDTVFTAMNRRQLLAVSREIEDRAFRAGTGTLTVSFQALSIFESQEAVYRTLATETDLEIHIYGRDDWDPPEIPGITYHGHADETLASYWLLAFDSHDEDGQASGLVAEQRGKEYRGFWTDDPDLLAEALTELGLR